jgi:hypothetical protein
MGSDATSPGDLTHELHVVKFLFSYHADAGVETLKLENFLRAVPNVTVVNPQDTRRQGGRKYVDVLIKVHDYFTGVGGIEEYVREVLIPSIKKNCPKEYRPTILDWKVVKGKPRPSPRSYRWRK